MIYLRYSLAGLIVLGSFLTIQHVGKPREPLTGTNAAVITLMNAVFVVALIR